MLPASFERVSQPMIESTKTGDLLFASLMSGKPWLERYAHSNTVDQWSQQPSELLARALAVNHRTCFKNAFPVFNFEVSLVGPTTRTALEGTRFEPCEPLLNCINDVQRELCTVLVVV